MSLLSAVIPDRSFLISDRCLLVTTITCSLCTSKLTTSVLRFDANASVCSCTSDIIACLSRSCNNSIRFLSISAFSSLLLCNVSISSDAAFFSLKRSFFFFNFPQRFSRLFQSLRYIIQVFICQYNRLFLLIAVFSCNLYVRFQFESC